MRNTVAAILQAEADRLHAIAIGEGLTTDNLIFLNKLIDTYEKFVGSSEEEESPPEEQDTAALLASLAPKPEPQNESRLSETGSETVAVGSGRTARKEEVAKQGQGSTEGQETDS